MSTYNENVKSINPVSYFDITMKRVKNLNSINKEYRKYEKYFRFNYGKQLPKKKSAIICDMACGIGESVYSLKKMGYTKVIGIDYDNGNVAFCKSQGLNVEQGSIYDYFKDKENTFDIIILNDIIEHISKERVIDVLCDIRKSLKCGGGVLIKTANGANPILSCNARYMDFTHELLYEETSIAEVLELSGFSSDKIVVKGAHLYCYWFNPLNYIAWLINSAINLFFRCYCIINFRKTKIFTKNIIAIARK